VNRNVGYAGYLKVHELRIELADGTLVSRDVETHGDAAGVLPYDTERRCALVVRLFRAPVFGTTREMVLEEACAGVIEKEDDEVAARREAYEELGVSLLALERVARIWSSPGVSTERQSLFLAPHVGRFDADYPPLALKLLPRTCQMPCATGATRCPASSWAQNFSAEFAPPQR